MELGKVTGVTRVLLYLRQRGGGRWRKHRGGASEKDDALDRDLNIEETSMTTWFGSGTRSCERHAGELDVFVR